MRTWTASRIIALATAAGLALAASPAAMAQSPAIESIEGRLQEYAGRYNRGDAEAVSRLYSEDVVYYGPLGRVFEGREAVEGHYQDNLAAGFSDMAIDVLEITVVGEIAYDLARYSIVAPDGTPLAGYHLAILEQEDGEWLVQRTVVNVVMPAPPATE